MKETTKSLKKYGLLAACLPFIAGCGGGVAFLGSLFSSSGTLLASASNAGSALSSAGAATLTNPEPATMLLMGSGMAAMAYFKSRKH